MCRVIHDEGSWAVRHFSQANPEGPDQGDVAELLRRVAETLDGLGAVDVVDLIMHNEVTANGDWPSLTVYFRDLGPH
jgi:hypothetical protein